MFTISGLFALGDGSREAVQTTTGPRTYCFYNTVLCCSDSDHIYRARLRVFGSQAPFPQGTVVLADVKVQVSTETVSSVSAGVQEPPITVLFEVMRMKEFPGDSLSPDYEKYAPDMPVGMTYCSGTVLFTNEVAAFDFRSRAFTLQVSDYVRDNPKRSVIRYVCELTFAAPLLSSESRCFLSAGNARWNTMKLPTVHQVVVVCGTLAHLAVDNVLMLQVENIQIMGSGDLGSTGGASEPSSTPVVKKRKIPLDVPLRVLQPAAATGALCVCFNPADASCSLSRQLD